MFAGLCRGTVAGCGGPLVLCAQSAALRPRERRRLAPSCGDQPSRVKAVSIRLCRPSSSWEERLRAGLATCLGVPPRDDHQCIGDDYVVSLKPPHCGARLYARAAALPFTPIPTSSRCSPASRSTPDSWRDTTSPLVPTSWSSEKITPASGWPTSTSGD